MAERECPRSHVARTCVHAYVHVLNNPSSMPPQASIFQCMHDTGSPPLPNCFPMKHVREDNGVWKNHLTQQTPSLFHFNGGGKAHHLNMESKVWYKSKATSPAAAEQVYNTELLFGDRMRTFREICPNHLEESGSGGGGSRGRRGKR